MIKTCNLPKLNVALKMKSLWILFQMINSKGRRIQQKLKLEKVVDLWKKKMKKLHMRRASVRFVTKCVKDRRVWAFTSGNMQMGWKDLCVHIVGRSLRRKRIKQNIAIKCIILIFVLSVGRFYQHFILFKFMSKRMASINGYTSVKIAIKSSGLKPI